MTYTGSVLKNTNIRDGTGKLVLKNGATYEGDFQNDKITGFGKGKIPHGPSYEGQWVDGIFEGAGTLTFDRYCFKGKFHAGLKHGKGVENHGNGIIITGTWRKGILHGPKIKIEAPQSTFIGDIKKGKKDGHGTYNCK